MGARSPDSVPGFDGLELVGLTKRYGELTAVRDFSARVERGETVAILGPSGCGKSTVLLLVAGLLQPDAGDVRWDGRSVVNLPTHRRGFGMMFQDFALFPHMDVAGNVAFGLEMAGREPEDRRRRVQEVLELVGLEGLDSRDVATLSGGQQQRVALARALAPDPALLMLDEPLGSLDRTLRERLMLDLSRILAETGQTALYVTHDQEEAFAVGDRVILMQTGAVHQVGTPEALYRQPASPYAARFLGLTNLIQGRVVQREGAGGGGGGAGAGANGLLTAETPVGRVTLAADRRSSADADGPSGSQLTAGDEVTVLLRPDAAHLVTGESDAPQRAPSPLSLPAARGARDTGALLVRGRVARRSFRGSETRIVIEPHAEHDEGLETLEFVLPSREIDLPSVGDEVALRVPADGIQIFPAE